MASQEENVRANAISPTIVLAGMGTREPWNNIAKLEEVCKRTPMARVADLYEIIDSILFFLSERSSYINGQTIHLDGGFSVAV